MKVGSVEIDLIANIERYTADMAKSARTASETAESIGKSFERIGEAIAIGEAFALMQEGFHKLIEVASDSETQMAKVKQAIVSTGGAAGVTATNVTDLAEKMRLLTGVNQEQIVSVEGLLLRFTKLHSDNFPKATKAVLDLSAGMGMDLHSAALKVGRAMEDPVKGLNLLQRAGVAVSQGQKDLVKELVKTGDIAGAQQVIIDGLTKSYGGMAAAARDTLGGAFKALNSDTDELVKSLGGPQGLRNSVELADETIKELTETIKQAKDPTTALGKQTNEFSQSSSKMWADLSKNVKNWANIVIFEFDAARDMLVQFATVWGDFFSGVNEGLQDTIPGLKAFQDNTLGALAKYTNFNQQAENLAKRGIVPDYLGKWFDPLVQAAHHAQDEVNKTLAATRAEAAKAAPHGQVIDEEGGPDAKAARAAAKELDKEAKALDGVIAGYEKKNEELKLQADGESKYKDLVAAEHKIQEQGNLTNQQRIDATNKLMQLEAEREKIEQRIVENGEKKKLEDVLRSRQEENAKAEARLNSQKSMVHELDAEDAIRRIVGKDTQVGLDLQRQILDAAKEAKKIEEETDHKAALKTLNDTLDAQRQSVQEDQLKLQGLGDEIPLLKEIDKIQKDINLTDAEKNDAINAAASMFEQQKNINDQLGQQKQVLDDIVKSADSTKDKEEKLKRAFDDTMITGAQYQEGMQRIAEAHQKVSATGSQAAQIITGSLEKMITGTVSASQGFKDMAKQLELLAIKTLILKPLEGLITNIGSALFGGGGNQGSGNSSSNGGGGIVGGLASGAWNWIKGKFATGGSFGPGGPYLVGEQGPELIMPSGGGQVFNNAQTQSFMGGGFQGSNVNGFGQYAAGLDPMQTLPQDLEQQLNQIVMAGQGNQYRQQALRLGKDSPYYNQLMQQASWGYNPMRGDGKAYNSDGQAENVLPMGGGYNFIANLAQQAGIQIPARLAQALQARDQYQRSIMSFGMSYGATGGGNSNFAGGDNGSSSGGYDVGGGGGGSAFAPGGLFGDSVGGQNTQYIGGSTGGNIWNAPTGGGSFAGGDGGGGTPYGENDYQTGLRRFASAGIGQPSWGDSLPSGAGASGWIPDGQSGESGGSSADSWNGGAGGYGDQSGAGMTTGKEDYAGGQRLFGSHNPDLYELQRALGLGATNGVLSAPVGEPVGVDLSSKISNPNDDVFNSGGGNPGSDVLKKNWAPWSNQSQVDNSGLTEGLLNGLAGFLPHHALGGVAQAGIPSIVGENGPELFIPNATGDVVPNNQWSKNRNGGGVTVNHTVINNAANMVSVDNVTDNKGNIKTLINVLAADTANGGRLLQAVAAGNTRIQR